MSDGPFSEHVGVDGTSIWSAATSGENSIAVHLLACMLATTFSPAEATSLMVEVVAGRKEEISSKQDDQSQVRGLADYFAIQQDISRAELASWDASARSWIQSANEAKSREVLQLKLIVKNINLPVNTSLSTYRSVVDTWVSAMTTMEKLIKGMPLRISTGAVLLGMEAWHIFPDLNIIGDKNVNVKFQDPLISSGGIITVGLIDGNTNADRDGVSWSLDLSYLRHYGDPVSLTKSIGTDGSRLTIEDLSMVAFGSLLASWKEVGQDTLGVAKFILAVYSHLKDAAVKKKRKRSTIDNHDPQNTDHEFQPKANSIDYSRSWLLPLAEAANCLLKPSNEANLDYYHMLIKLGKRRGKEFLAEQRDMPRILFGLSHPLTLHSMSSDSHKRDAEGSVQVLRALATKLGLKPWECIIRYNRSQSLQSTLEIEYASAVACQPEILSSQRATANSLPGHERWITHPSKKSGCLCQNNCTTGGCGCLENGRSCGSNCAYCFFGGDVACDNLGDRYNEIVAADGKCSWISPSGLGSSISSVRSEEWTWTSPPTYFWPPGMSHVPNNYAITFELLAGSRNSVAGLFTIKDNRYASRLAAQVVPLLEVMEFLESTEFIPGMLYDHLEAVIEEGHQSIVKSLRGLFLMSALDKEVGSLNASVGIISKPLHQAYWIPEKSSDAGFNAVSRSVKFACIAMLELGSACNLGPDALEHVMAMSSGNSIFTSTNLLTDPAMINKDQGIKRVIGNLGRAGIVMLVPPANPRIRPLTDEWRQIQHAKYDGNLENKFSQTSLHVSFTLFEVPLSFGIAGGVDREVIILETLVSVHDRGKWVADLNVPDSLSSGRLEHMKKCAHGLLQHRNQTLDRTELTSIDNWEELLDPPEGFNLNFGAGRAAIVRAHNNWTARLAAACISVQKGYRTVVLPPGPVCMSCLPLTLGFDTPWSGTEGLAEKMGVVNICIS